MTSVPQFVKNLFKIVAYVFTAVASLFAAFFAVFIVLIILTVGLAADEVDIDKKDLQLKHHAGNKKAEHQLVSIPVSGIILGERDELPSFMQFLSELNITYGYEVKETLYQLAERDDVEGVILELHSPGGTIYGTTAIANGVDYYQQQTGKPVVAYVGSVAASGGYWAAASADQVVADNGTSIGSIGIIAGPFKYYEGVVEESGAFGSGVTTTEGINTEFITAGQSKDLGNPYRPLTNQERNILQTSVNNSYQKFVNYLATERQLNQDTIRGDIGALIYDEVQAQDHGLIDATMSREQAYNRLANLANVQDYQILRERRLEGFFGSLSSALSTALLPETTAANLPFCSDRTAVLVYSGDITALCSR